MNEDERGITPADSTSISVSPLDGGGWWVVIEQGNGDVIKDIKLTEMERIQLAMMICTEPGTLPTLNDVGFLDFDRGRTEPYPAASTGTGARLCPGSSHRGLLPLTVPPWTAWRPA